MRTCAMCIARLDITHGQHSLPIVCSAEDIPLVQEIAAVVDPPKAVILGNHDAWCSLVLLLHRELLLYVCHAT